MKWLYILIISGLLAVWPAACAPETEPAAPIIPTETATTAPTPTPPATEALETRTKPAETSTEPPVTEATPTAPPELEGESPMSISIPAHLENLVNEIKRDLAGRITVDIEAIAVTKIEAVQWSDSSLGCPEPGMAYLTVITPGYRISLEVEGKVYYYHTDERGHFVWCQREGPPGPTLDSE